MSMQREHLSTGLPCSDALTGLLTLLCSKGALPGIDSSVSSAPKSWTASHACSPLQPSCLARMIKTGSCHSTALFFTHILPDGHPACEHLAGGADICSATLD